MDIKLNKLKPKIEKAALNGRYDFFEIRTSEKFFKHGAKILDAPALCKNIEAVCFEGGAKFFTMMRKNEGNKNALIKTLRETEGGDSISLKAILAGDLGDRTLLQLLLNSLGTYESEFLKVSNLTGHLYYFNPKWLKRKQKGGQSFVAKISALEPRITENMELVLNVRTFTSKKLKAQILFEKGKSFESYPQYVNSERGAMRRALKEDKEKDHFIMRQTEGSKEAVAFLDLQSAELFAASKVGSLHEILAAFEKKFGELCKLEFETATEDCSIELKNSASRQDKALVLELLKERQIKIVDEVLDETSKCFCEKLKRLLKSDYGIEASIGRRISKEALNLCVIHNEEYYGGYEDPHSKPVSGAVVQHVTLEDFSPSSAIETVVHELLIKQDIRQGKLSLFAWPKAGFAEEVYFAVMRKIGEISRYFFMKIFPDGTFKFEERELDLFSENEYSTCLKIFDEHKACEGLVKRADGAINIIEKTELFGLPDFEKIQRELGSGNNKLRGKARRTELMASILDIRLFEHEGAKHYFVGTVGEGMKAKVACAANIRKVVPYGDAPVMLEALLGLMDVRFVRTGRPTVVPFPFKYLNEWIDAKAGALST